MIKHFMLVENKKIMYLCNQACGFVQEKLTVSYTEVT